MQMPSLMRGKGLFIVLAAVTAVGYGSYEVARFLYLLDHPTLGTERGSTSQRESRAGGFYLGTYVPTRRVVGLQDGSVIHVPDAWVEHARKSELTFLLQGHQVPTSDYYLYIPIHPDESTESGQTWPFKFALRLDQQGQELSRAPGISYEETLGFPVFLQTLPSTIRFTVVQKSNRSDSWADAIPIESIEFRRGF